MKLKKEQSAWMAIQDVLAMPDLEYYGTGVEEIDMATRHGYHQALVDMAGIVTNRIGWL